MPTYVTKPPVPVESLDLAVNIDRLDYAIRLIGRIDVRTEDNEKIKWNIIQALNLWKRDDEWSLKQFLSPIKKRLNTKRH